MSEYLLLLILLLISCFCEIISIDDEILAAKHTHTHTHTEHKFEKLEVALGCLKGAFATYSSPLFCLGSSQNASEYEPCGGERLLGLGNTGEKSANKRSWECQSFGSFQVPVVDEGSSSARVTCGGYMPSLLMGSSVFPPFPSLQTNETGTAAAVEEDFMEQNLSMSFHQQGSTTSTSSRSGHSDRPLKVCKFRGCGKGPRGASGLCIAHGGGRRFVWFVCPVGSAHFPVKQEALDNTHNKVETKNCQCFCFSLAEGMVFLP